MIARGSRYPWWLWPNILSLDAPVVALVWQMWFARCFQVDVAPQYYCILFLTVWLIYALDRWLDGWKLDISKPHSSRHRFYLDYRWPIAGVWTGALAVALMILPQLSRVVIVRGLGVLVGCIGYLLLAHVLWKALPKEVLVGLMVSLGVTLCFWPVGGMLVLPATTFAGLITLNCLVISHTEALFDRAQGYTSVVWAGKSLDGVFVGWILLGCILSFRDLFYLPLLLSMLGLWGLFHVHKGLSPALKRVLADVLLLTPVLVFVAQFTI